MSQVTLQQRIEPPPTVEEVAALIRQMNRRDQAKLLQLIPELTTIEEQPTLTPAYPSEVRADDDLDGYIKELWAKYPGAQSVGKNDSFIGELTMDEFFALPEEEQGRRWRQAHLEADNELGPNRERPVRPDALPAR